MKLFVCVIGEKSPRAFRCVGLLTAPMTIVLLRSNDTYYYHLIVYLLE